MDVKKTLNQAKQLYQDRPALAFGDQQTTFSALEENSLKFAKGLLDLGFKKGDRIAIYLPNCPEYFYAYLGLYVMGTTAVPIDFLLQEDEIASMLNHSEAQAIITTSSARFDLKNLKQRVHTLKEIIVIEEDTAYQTFWGLIHASRPDPKPQKISEDDLSNIFYTSGSTGKPKGVLWNFRHLDIGVDSVQHFFPLGSDDRTIAAVPFSHSAGVLFPMFTIKYGMFCLIMQRFSPLEFVRAIQEQKITIIWLVPAMFLAIINLKELAAFDFSSLKWVVVFGAPSSPEIIQQFKRLCPKATLVHGWGMTETSPPTTVNASGDAVSVGKAAPWANIRIVNNAGQEVPCGQIGEITIKGPGLFQGYYKDPELTWETIRDGWFHTGDLGRIDQMGNLSIAGRIKDTLKVAGELVYTQEIEEVLLKHPCIAEAAVIGVEDQLRGEVPKAHVVLKESIIMPVEHLRWYCRQHLANFKVPHYFEFRGSLPKTGSGKINKLDLKREELEKLSSKQPLVKEERT